MVEHCQTYIVFYADTEDAVMAMRDNLQTIETVAIKSKSGVPNGKVLASTYFPRDWERFLRGSYNFDVDDRIDFDGGKFHFAVCSDDLAKCADETSVDLFAAIAKIYYPGVGMRYDCVEEANGICRKWDPEQALRDGEIHLFLRDGSLPAWGRAENSAVECDGLEDLKEAMGDKFPMGAKTPYEAIKKINASGAARATYWENVEPLSRIEKLCDIGEIKTVDIDKKLGAAIKNIYKGETK